VLRFLRFNLDDAACAAPLPRVTDFLKLSVAVDGYLVKSTNILKCCFPGKWSVAKLLIMMMKEHSIAWERGPLVCRFTTVKYEIKAKAGYCAALKARKESVA